MWKKNSSKVVLVLIVLFLVIFSYFYLNKKEPIKETQTSEEQKEEVYKSNITKDVNYTSQDINGNFFRGLHRN